MTQVDQLLPLKNEIDELRKRVKEVKRVLNEVLQSNDDILAMNTLHEQHLDMILKVLSYLVIYRVFLFNFVCFLLNC